MYHTTAIVLAGGRGSRLAEKGVPTFEKPLHLVQGVPAIVHSLNFARQFGVDETIVVTSPAIEERVQELLVPHEFSVVQPVPNGVVNALCIGLGACATQPEPDYVLLLCSDNTFDHRGEWFRDYLRNTHDVRLALAVRDGIARADAVHLTQVTRRGQLYRGDKFHEGRCWVGPVLVRTSLLRFALTCHDKLEDVFNSMRPLTQVPMDCEDHGR